MPARKNQRAIGSRAGLRQQMSTRLRGKERMAPTVGGPGGPHEIRGHDGVCAQGRHTCAAVSKVTVVGSGAGTSRARERNQVACWESKGQTEATGGRVEGRQTERLQYKARVQYAHPLQLLNSKPRKLSQENKHKHKSRTPDQAKPQDGKGGSLAGKTDDTRSCAHVLQEYLAAWKAQQSVK